MFKNVTSSWFYMSKALLESLFLITRFCTHLLTFLCLQTNWLTEGQSTNILGHRWWVNSPLKFAEVLNL